MSETLVYEDSHHRLWAAGLDAPDEVPLVLRSVCVRCGHEIHRREIAITEESCRAAGLLAGFDAATAMAHRAVCPA